MLPYAVRERRFDPRSYLPLVVGAVLLWFGITDGGDPLGLVLGVISGGGLVVLGLLMAWTAVRRECVLEIDRDGFVVGGRRLPWADITVVRTWIETGDAESSGVQSMVQVELADGTVERTWPIHARYDSRQLEAAVREAAPQVQILSNTAPEPDPQPTIDAILGPLKDWVNRRRARRGRPPIRRLPDKR